MSGEDIIAAANTWAWPAVGIITLILYRKHIWILIRIGASRLKRKS